MPQALVWIQVIRNGTIKLILILFLKNLLIQTVKAVKCGLMITKSFLVMQDTILLFLLIITVLFTLRNRLISKYLMFLQIVMLNAVFWISIRQKVLVYSHHLGIKETELFFTNRTQKIL